MRLSRRHEAMLQNAMLVESFGLVPQCVVEEMAAHVQSLLRECRHLRRAARANEDAAQRWRRLCRGEGP